MYSFTSCPSKWSTSAVPSCPLITEISFPAIPVTFKISSPISIKSLVENANGLSTVTFVPPAGTPTCPTYKVNLAVDVDAPDLTKSSSATDR